MLELIRRTSRMCAAAHSGDRTALTSCAGVCCAGPAFCNRMSPLQRITLIRGRVGGSRAHIPLLPRARTRHNFSKTALVPASRADCTSGNPNPDYSSEIHAGSIEPLQCRKFSRNVVKIDACILRFAIRRVCAVPATLATSGAACVNNPGYSV